MPCSSGAEGPLKGELEKILAGIRKKDEDPGNCIRENWGDFAGKRISDHSKPYALKNRTLFVRVDNATWAYELAARYKAHLLKRLQDKFGEKTVKDICFKIGDLL